MITMAAMAFVFIMIVMDKTAVMAIMAVIPLITIITLISTMALMTIMNMMALSSISFAIFYILVINTVMNMVIVVGMAINEGMSTLAVMDVMVCCNVYIFSRGSCGCIASNDPNGSDSCGGQGAVMAPMAKWL